MTLRLPDPGTFGPWLVRVIDVREVVVDASSRAEALERAEAIAPDPIEWRTKRRLLARRENLGPRT